MNNTVWLYYGNNIDSHIAFPAADPEKLDLGFLLRRALLQAGHDPRPTNSLQRLGNFKAIISYDLETHVLDQLHQYPRERCFLILFEPPVVAPEGYGENARKHFGKIFVLLDEFVDGNTYIKFHCPMANDCLLRISETMAVDFEQRKLCCMINGNKYFHADPGELYTERRKLVSFLTLQGGVDLYGAGWNGVSSWTGICPPQRTQVLKDYKFCFCYENTGNKDGVISDRLFASLYARCVPIYLGAPNIAHYVPKECFIDRREFRSNQEIYEFIRSMSRATWERYILAGQDYIDNNPNMKLFSKQDFTDRVLAQVNAIA